MGASVVSSELSKGEKVRVEDRRSQREELECSRYRWKSGEVSSVKGHTSWKETVGRVGGGIDAGKCTKCDVKALQAVLNSAVKKGKVWMDEGGRDEG